MSFLGIVDDLVKGDVGVVNGYVIVFIICVSFLWECKGDVDVVFVSFILMILLVVVEFGIRVVFFV